jgi:hypothetical protein
MPADVQVARGGVMNFLSFLLVNRPDQALTAHWGDDPANHVSRNLQTLIVVAIGDGANKLTAYGIDPAHLGSGDQPIYEIAIPRDPGRGVAARRTMS